MLIIVVSLHGSGTVVSSHSKATREQVDPSDVDSVTTFVVNDQKFGSREDIDELLVIENDDVIAAYYGVEIYGVLGE